MSLKYLFYLLLPFPPHLVPQILLLSCIRDHPFHVSSSPLNFSCEEFHRRFTFCFASCWRFGLSWLQIKIERGNFLLRLWSFKKISIWSLGHFKKKFVIGEINLFGWIGSFLPVEKSLRFNINRYLLKREHLLTATQPLNFLLAIRPKRKTSSGNLMRNKRRLI